MFIQTSSLKQTESQKVGQDEEKHQVMYCNVKLAGQMFNIMVQEKRKHPLIMRRKMGKET